MSNSRRTFRNTFLIVFAVQFVVWLAFVVSAYYEETKFHEVVLWFYAPTVSILEWVQFAIGWRTWISFGLQVLLGPLLGAALYSLVIAYLVHMVRRNRFARPA